MEVPLKAPPKFKKGDLVIVIKKGDSANSRSKFGSTFTVHQVLSNPIGEGVVTSSEYCMGYWTDELELEHVFNSPLYKALS